MNYHPDVLAAHAEFGGDLASMQALYDRPDHIARIEALEREVAKIEAERDEYRRFAAHWHSQCQIVATVLSLPEPEGTNHAECVRSAFEAAEADKARLSEALRKGREIAVDVMKALMTTGSRDNLLLADTVHKADDAARAALSGSNPAWRTMAKPLDAWHEDDGFVTWWTWRDGQWLGEPSYIGSPLCSDWPGYHTHWTKHPDFPSAPQQGGE